MPSKLPSCANTPVERHGKYQCQVKRRDVVHRTRCGRHGGRKAVDNDDEGGPGEDDEIGNEADIFAEPEGSVSDSAAAVDQ